MIVGNCYPVALLGLVPKDEALLVVADALRSSGLLVVLEQVRFRTRTAGEPLVALSGFRPVVLVVSGRAAALAPERLSRILFEDDEFSERTGASASDLTKKFPVLERKAWYLTLTAWAYLEGLRGLKIEAMWLLRVQN